MNEKGEMSMYYPLNYFSSVFSAKKIFLKRGQLSIGQAVLMIIVLVGIAMFPLSFIVGQTQVVDLSLYTPKAVATIEASHLAAFNQLVDGDLNDLPEDFQTVRAQEVSELIIAKNGFVIQEENKPTIQQPFLDQLTLRKVQSKKELLEQLAAHWFADNRFAIIITQFVNLWLLVFVSYLTIILGSTLFIGWMKKSPYFTIKSFKDAFGLVVHAIAMPTICATILATILKSPILITYGQSLIFILWVLYIYWRTHFNDEYLLSEDDN